MNKPLQNTKHELFALLVFQRVPLSRAYVSAGYRARGHSAEVLASRLLKKVEIQARLEGLKRESASEAVLSRQQTLEILSAIIRGQVLATVVWQGAELQIGPDWSARLRAMKQLAQLEGWEKQQEAVQDSGLTELSRHFQGLREERSNTQN